MAELIETQKTFDLYVTNVDSVGHFVKISGLIDKQGVSTLDDMFEAAYENLEKGIGAVLPADICEGIICAVKYKNNLYYRAKITNITNLTNDLVGVRLIDFGEEFITSINTLRFLNNYDPKFLQLREQVNDYYLSRVKNIFGIYKVFQLYELRKILNNGNYDTTVDAQTITLPIVSMQFHGNDLSTYLISNGFGDVISLAEQEVELQSLCSENYQRTNLLSTLPSNIVYRSFLINHKFPINLASVMLLQQNDNLLFNTSVPSTSVQPTFLDETTIYKSLSLEVNSQHVVFVSHAEGPEVFTVQFMRDAKKLQDMMKKINSIPQSISHFKEPPMMGTMCLGRMPGDNCIGRAIIVNILVSECELFFCDYGNTEMVSYNDIYEIPEEFLEPDIFAIKFCLSGLKNLNKGPHLSEYFKQRVVGKVMNLKVVAPEGPPLIQYGELCYDNSENESDVSLTNIKDKLEFKWMGMLPMGTNHSVLVSYVENCIKFYIQLTENKDELDALNETVKVHCENSSHPSMLPVGMACCARSVLDGKWYRAKIREIKDNKVIVTYVDYGNEQEIEIFNLRTITPELTKLPAQALKCALLGFENRLIEDKASRLLEMLALNKTLIAFVVGVLSYDTMLVLLFYESIIPALGVACNMNQQCQPRNATPRFQANQGANRNQSTNKCKNVFIQELENFSKNSKSFKEDRQSPKETNDDFTQTGGSFRERDNNFNHNDDLEEKENNDWRNKSVRDKQPDKHGESRNDRPDNWSDNKEYAQSELRNNSNDRNERNDGACGIITPPRGFADLFMNSDTDNHLETTSYIPENYGRVPLFKKYECSLYQYGELSEPISLTTPFLDPTINLSEQHEVMVRCPVFPENFYCQIRSLEKERLLMALHMQRLYKGVKSYVGNVPVGASVVARNSDDGWLCRGTVVSVHPFSKFTILFVDYGFKQIVDIKDIWQLEKELMMLPKTAVHCSVLGVMPEDSEWKAYSDRHLLSEQSCYRCVFHACSRKKQYKVSLWDSKLRSLADLLLEKGLAVLSKEPPIDLTILKMQEVLCKVTHVKSYEEFYVQPDLEKAEFVETVIANLDDILKPLKPDTLSEGLLCMLKHEGKVYRAVLRDVSDTTRITALLPDYGNTVTTRINDLKILPTELSVFNYQSLQCKLNNYKADSKILIGIDELKRRLTGNKIIIYVDSVDGTTVESSLYSNVTGNKLSVFEPDADAYEQVLPVCLRSIFNYNFGIAKISHVKDLDKIYLHKVTDEDRIDHLMDSLYAFYEGTPESLTSFAEGGLCATKTVDGNWRRAIIINVKDTEVEVEYFDYGNTETVLKDSVKSLDYKFYEPCAFALVVTLGIPLIRGGNHRLIETVKWAMQQEYQVTISLKGQAWLAKLNVNGVDLSNKFIDEYMKPSSY